MERSCLQYHSKTVVLTNETPIQYSHGTLTLDATEDIVVALAKPTVCSLKRKENHIYTSQINIL